MKSRTALIHDSAKLGARLFDDHGFTYYRALYEGDHYDDEQTCSEPCVVLPLAEVEGLVERLEAAERKLAKASSVLAEDA